MNRFSQFIRSLITSRLVINEPESKYKKLLTRRTFAFSNNENKKKQHSEKVLCWI